jgi:predicted phosphodiesterase
VKIQVASDLHLELLRELPPAQRVVSRAPECDVLVLAGDIAAGASAVELFKDWGVPVVYVPGNHEYYGRDLRRTQDELRERAQGTAVHVLDSQALELDGVRFLGATLWTDYKVGPAGQQAHRARAEATLNDHARIQCEGDAFTTGHALQEHLAARRWLQQALAVPFEGATVVVSHHGPHPQSVHPRFAGDTLNAAFVSNLPELLSQADLWVHGHTHDSFDYVAEGCRVVANPAGYVTGHFLCDDGTVALQLENARFNPTFVVDTADLVRQRQADPAEA